MAGNHHGMPRAAAPLANGRPDTSAFTSPAEFVAAMRALKGWSGLSYRQLEAAAARCGMGLPRSTLVNALGRETLPREELVVAFVRACGGDENDTAGWLAARRRLAAAATRTGPATTAGTTDRPSQEAVLVLALTTILICTLAVAGLAIALLTT